MIKLSEIATLLNGELIGDDAEFADICTDTRSIKKGDLYIALKGEALDGHDFVLEAQRKVLQEHW